LKQANTALGLPVCLAMNDGIIDRIAGLPRSLYQPEEEHDSCGVGFVAAIDGQRSNRVLRYGLTSVCNMVHRGAVDADAKTGDGSGVMTQIPYKIFRREIAKLGHRSGYRVCVPAA
jgi:glutamate synthase domain-containing protein 1